MPSWKEIYMEYKGRILGIAGGIGLGIVYLVSGFVDTLIFALLVFIGYTLGKRIDAKLDVFQPLEKLGEWIFNRKRPFK
ncbi:DUF2273 domain-containing protein [Paenibacillus sp. P96]|uniref:DUF2273 domain-containing protein n=1 Tax=Paenibacillus zeirhizosphaerae TaxID=2987519 RepID=A0ABT9FPS6_9BACL|nr:DUF2273 domain-containing protein [Paenibacillus sp. P96]MDP4096738.1 DUF2273 domain-containing protein [Paenibacillus sp. P96]